MQVDGEWEEEDNEEDADIGESSTGTASQAGGSSMKGEEGGSLGEEELHTPKLSQRGLQLRAQMMKYGLSIFILDQNWVETRWQFMF